MAVPILKAGQRLEQATALLGVSSYFGCRCESGRNQNRGRRLHLNTQPPLVSSTTWCES